MAFLIGAVGASVFLYMNASLGNLKSDELMKIGKIIQANQDLSMFQEMMQCMEEAILVVKDQSIEFSNNVYNKMVTRVNMPSIPEHDINMKFIRVHHKVDDEDKEAENICSELFSISDLIEKG